MPIVFKRSVSLLLVLLLGLGCMVSAFAQDVTDENVAADETQNTQRKENTDATDEKIVAKASLFTALYFFPVAGHTWIYVENLSDEPITVGLYEVPVGQGVSVGAFSFSVNDGWGIYYNVEAYRENRDDNIANCRSLTIELTREKLEELSESIRNYPNMWEFFIFNCTFFAFSIWNDNSDNFFIPMIIPAIAILEVMIMGAKKGVTPMYYPTSDQIFRQRGSGDEAYLEPISEKTLNRS